MSLALCLMHNVCSTCLQPDSDRNSCICQHFDAHRGDAHSDVHRDAHRGDDHLKAWSDAHIYSEHTF